MLGIINWPGGEEPAGWTAPRPCTVTPAERPAPSGRPSCSLTLMSSGSQRHGSCRRRVHTTTTTAARTISVVRPTTTNSDGSLWLGSMFLSLDTVTVVGGAEVNPCGHLLADVVLIGTFWRVTQLPNTHTVEPELQWIGLLCVWTSCQNVCLWNQIFKINIVSYLNHFKLLCDHSEAPGRTTCLFKDG